MFDVFHPQLDNHILAAASGPISPEQPPGDHAAAELLLLADCTRDNIARPTHLVISRVYLTQQREKIKTREGASISSRMR
jgi:hypothetical protein